MHLNTNPRSRNRKLHLPLWALINVGSLLAMHGVLTMWPGLTGALALAVASFFMAGPVVAAALLDARWRTLGVLNLSTWALMAIAFIALTFTEQWRRDCGLGQGFTALFAAMGAAAYPLASGVVFTLVRSLARFTGLTRGKDEKNNIADS
jgi:hypothetical protein